MKEKIKKLPGFTSVNKLRKRVANYLSLIRNFFYDYRKFKKHYSLETSSCFDKKSLESWILQDKHRLEKGLSLPSPRLGFGELVIKRLCQNLKSYSDSYSKTDVYFFGVGALNAYEKFHQKKAGNVPTFFKLAISNIPTEDFLHLICKRVGVSPYDDKNVTSENEYVDFFNRFSSSRHSCRNFDNERTVEDHLLDSIIKLSITTPSVCNRQHWKVHIFEGESKNKILKLQNGNTGFSENIPYVAVITSDIRAFYHPNERNQSYVDGGMFSMNFIYALHSNGIASCPLNWCASVKSDKELHAYNYIQDNETVIMFIAFGYPLLAGLYAKSPRLSYDVFLERHT